MSDRMNSKSSRPSERFFRFGAVYFLLFITLFVLYLFLAPLVTLYGSPDEPVYITVPYTGDAKVRLVMAALLTALAFTALLLRLGRQMTAGKAITLIILGGIVMRFGVMLYTPFFIHGHDVDTYGGYGHLDYIVRLYDTFRLPETNLGQFYHPPLAHFLAAVTARLYAAVTGIVDRDTVFQSARLVPCFFSCAALLLCLRLFDALELPGRAKLFALTVVAFHPTFFLLTSSINNDMAMVFFFLAAVLQTVRWYKNPSYKNVLLLAFSISAAMSAKFSGAVAAVFTAGVFLIVLIRHIINDGGLSSLGQFAAFSAVCFPLGLWHPVRNLIVFRQPLGYVAEIPRESGLYIGDIAVAERLLTFNPMNVLLGGYCNPWEDYRLWEYAVKSALFGEFAFPETLKPVGVVLTGASLFLIALSLAGMVWLVLKKTGESRLAVWSMAAVWLVAIASFVYFNIRYPFGCTMDFRYIVPTVVTGAVFSGLLFDALCRRRQKAPPAAMIVVLAVYVVSAAGFYIM